jgi:hypothetical protein
MNGQPLHKLVAGLVRRTWLLAVVTTIACAVFAASAVAALVEASYLAPAAHGAPLPAPVKRETPAVKPPPDGSVLVARNMFCSTCTPSIVESGAADFFVPAAILIATSVGDEARCTVRVPASEVQGSFGVGDMIPGIGTIDRIGWRTVDVLDVQQRRGRLSLLETAGTGAATPDPAVGSADPIASRIKKIDDHTFEVDRDLVRDLVSGNVKQTGLRIVPVPDGDKLKGLRMFGVKQGALASMLGLQNGDMLQAINNTPIKSAQTLLDVYSQLDTLNVVELDGIRAGKPLALTLKLR